MHTLSWITSEAWLIFLRCPGWISTETWLLSIRKATWTLTEIWKLQLAQGQWLLTEVWQLINIYSAEGNAYFLAGLIIGFLFMGAIGAVMIHKRS
jgi:hypothetical protein